MAKQAKHVGVVAMCVALLLTGACGGSEAPTPVSAEAQEDRSGPTLYWLDIWEGSVYRATGPDFDDAERLVHPTDTAPDGVAVDVSGGKLYWTNMGDLDGFGGGTLQRAALDGSDVERIVEPGVTHTPKQLGLDLDHGHAYWSDRGSATIWRAGLDGAAPEAVVAGHGLREPVGIALDVPDGQLYVSDRASRQILRAGLAMPDGQTAATRADVQVLHSFPEGAMPVDLAIDPEAGHLYWTDRALGTVQRSGLDLPAGEDPATRTDVETLAADLFEPIGIALDLTEDKLYYGQAGNPLEGVPGTVTQAALDGSGPRELSRGNVITGVAVVHLPQD